MKLLRHDLILTPGTGASEPLTVHDPVARKQLEFEPKEAFLIKAVREPYNELVLLRRYNAAFSEKESLDFLREFLRDLGEQGLLEGTEPVLATTGSSEQEASAESPAEATLPQSGLGSEAGPPARKSPQVIRFGNPRNLLSWLTQHLHWMSHLRMVVILASILSAGIVFFNPLLFRQQLGEISGTISLFEHLTLTLVTVNLLTQIVRGCVARYYELPTPSFGIVLAFSILPRFHIQVEQNQASLAANRHLAASSIYVRLALFASGTIAWFLTFGAGHHLALIGAAVALFSVISLFFVVNPLVNSDGYRLITLTYGMPNLRRKAIRSFKNAFLPTPEVVKRHTDDRLALKIYGGASLLFIASLVTFLGYSVSHWLEAEYRGMGVVIFLLLVTYMTVRLRQMARSRRRMQAGLTENTASPEVAEDAREVEMNRTARSGSRWGDWLRRVRPIRLLLLIGLGILLFLPYRYHAGGHATVEPLLSQELFAEGTGIVDQVYYEGGEWLEAGTVVAVMQSHRQTRDIVRTKNEILRTEAELQTLLTTPTEAQIALAKEELVTAKSQLKFEEDDFKRAESLLESNVISSSDYADTEEQLEVSRQRVKEKEANLEHILNQVNEHSIAALRAELALLQEELAFYEDQYERTKLRMPNDGRLVTMNLKNLEKKYLDDGMPFAEIENAGSIKLEINVPEADADIIAVGAPVTFKAQFLPQTPFEGEVTAIYPSTTESDTGTMVTVVSVFPNPDDLLKTGMTGFAKIQGEEMPVYQAFTRSLVRFFQIELWSWLP